jgi:predicted DNA-binding transcriptional regulator AlpA
MNETRTLRSLLSGKNAAHVAEQLGKGRATVYAWINEDRSPSITDIPALAKVTGLSIPEMTAVILATAQRIAKRRKAA